MTESFRSERALGGLWPNPARGCSKQVKLQQVAQGHFQSGSENLQGLILAVPTFLFFIHTETTFWSICSIIFPGNEVRLTTCHFLPRSSFLSFLKIGATFALFQSTRTSPSCHDPSKLMGEWPHNDTSYLPQHSGMHFVWSHGLVYVQLV